MKNSILHRFLWIALAAPLLLSNTQAQIGSLDLDYIPGGRTGAVYAVLPAGGNKMWIAGSFGVQRVNHNGGTDGSYPGVQVGGGDVVSLAALPDGSLILGGTFTSVNGVAVNRIAKVDPNGVLVPNFVTNVGAGFDGGVWALHVQADGKILAGGTFSTFNTVARFRIARLNPSGSLDTSFDTATTGPNGDVFAIVADASGVYIGGAFSSVGATARFNLARLLSTTGELDTGFGTETSGPNGSVNALGVAADGSLVVAGNFTSIDGEPSGRIARLSSSGDTDSNFNTNVSTGADGPVYAISIQADGKILLAGDFDAVNGTTRASVARLETTGALDVLFDPNLGPDSGTRVFAMTLQPDGKAVVGGNFNTFDGQSRPLLARLLSTGSTGVFEFRTGNYNIIGGDQTIQITVFRRSSSSGSATVDFEVTGGTATPDVDFQTTSGTLVFEPGETRKTFPVTIIANNAATSDLVANMALTNPSAGASLGTTSTGTITIFSLGATAGVDGALDLDFYPGYRSGGAERALSRNDGTVWIYGDFGVARINSNGSTDSTFSTAAINGNVRGLVEQSDGKVIIAGRFTSIGGVSSNGIARLNANGTLDTTFNPGSGFSDSNFQIESLALQTDGKVLAGGSFLGFNGQSRSTLVRLNSNGSLDTAFNPSITHPNGYPITHSIALQSDGKILIGGYFDVVNGIERSGVARLNTDGTTDLAFNPGTGARGGSNQNATVQSIALAPDGRVLLAGEFTSFDGFPVSKVCRLLSSGTLDRSFDPDSGPSGSVYAVALQGDGKVFIGGAFSQVEGVDRNNYARLNVDGSLDRSYQFGGGANGSVYGLNVLSGGQLLLAGGFSSVAGSDRFLIAKLKNRSESNAGSFAFSAQAYSGQESAPNITIYVYRIGGLSTAAAVDYQTTVDGIANDPATPDQDYQSTQGTLSFAPGEWVQSFTVSISQDSLLEPNENFRVVLSNPTGGAALISPTSSTITLLSDHNGLALSGTLDSGVNTTFGSFRRILPTGGGKFWWLSDFGVARINSNGSTDPTFSTAAINGNVRGLVEQSDGKVIIAGRFTSIGGVSRNGIARLNANGTLDTTFNPGSGFSDSNFQIESLALQRDGKVLAAGYFQGFNGQSRSTLVRLNSNGSLDTAFNPSITYPGGYTITHSIALQTDGKILIGGYFGSVNGIERSGVARLNTDGSTDLAFNPGTGARGGSNQSATVRTLALMADGRVAIAGEFTNFDGRSCGRVMRLLSTGGVDPSFLSLQGADSTVNDLAVDPAGRIVIGGYFTKVDGLNRPYLARLNLDGTLDQSFDAGSGPNGIVNGVTLLPEGRLGVAGGFTSFSGVAKFGLAVVNLETVPGAGVFSWLSASSIASERDGNLLLQVRRAGGARGTASVQYTTSNGTGFDGTDYTSSSGNVTFADGQTLATVAIPIIDNSLVAAGNTTFTVTLSNPSPGASLGSLTTTTVSILDNDTGFLPIASPDHNFIGPLSSPGTLDQARKMLPALGGKFWIFGDYGLARLNADGTNDSSFTRPSFSSFGRVLSLVEQGDGKIIIAGSFTSIGGVSRNGIARLSANGTLDTTFNPGSGFSDSNFQIESLALQTDGKVLVGGYFQGFNGQSRSALVRLNSNGSLDTAFNPSIILYASGARVYSIALQSDGKILIGGLFDIVNGSGPSGIARLNTNGTTDTAFNPGGGPFSYNAPYFYTATVRSLALMADGRIAICGDFNYFDGRACRQVMRLLSTGGVDPNFVSPEGVNGTVNDLAVDSYGRIVIGGWFQKVDGLDRNSLARFNADGSLDQSFDPGSGPNGFIYGVTILPDGRIAVAGGFRTFNGTPANSVVILTDGNTPSPGSLAFSQASSLVRKDAGNITLTVSRTNGTTGPASASYRTVDGSASQYEDYTGTTGTLSFAHGETSKAITIPIQNNPNNTTSRSFTVVLEEPSLNVGIGAISNSSVTISGVIPPTITTQPTGRQAYLGGSTTFTVAGTGSPAPTYAWRLGTTVLANGPGISGANTASLTLSNMDAADAGNYTVTLTNAGGSVTSDPARLTLVEPPQLRDVLNLPSYTFSTGGNAQWFGQTVTTHDGVSAAQSGQIGHSQQTYIETTVAGPGTLSFWWKVSSEAGYDHLTVRVNGDQPADGRISGEVDWVQKTIAIPIGAATVRWTYAKDESGSEGQDAAWLDEVVYTPDANVPATITTEPQPILVSVGDTVNWQVAAGGTGPLTFRWQRNQVDLVNGGRISGANTANLTISNAATSDEGTYRLIVSNAFGTDTSQNATLTVAKSSQTISFPALSNAVLGNQVISLNATSSSGLPVSYSIVSGPASVSGSSLSLTGAGTVVVRASQSGDATYAAAPSVDRSFSVSAPPLPVVQSPGVQSLTVGTFFSLQLQISGNPTSISANGLPPGLSIDSSGLLSGTPVVAGTFNPSLTASNISGSSNAVSFAVNVVAAPAPTSFAGIYQGLLGSSDYGDLGTAALAAFYKENGFVSLTVSSMRAFTGFVTIAGKKYVLSGVFGTNGQVSVSGKDFSASITLLDSNPATIVGAFTIPSLSSDALAFSASLSPFDGKTSIFPMSGKRMNMVLARDPGSTIEIGYGYAFASFAKSGTATITGVLADGTKITAKTGLVNGETEDEWMLPLSVPIKSKTGGLLQGWLSIPKATSPGEPQITGNLDWLRRPLARDPFAPDGFLESLNVAGLVYNKPLANSNLLLDAPGSAAFTLALDSNSFMLPTALSISGTWPSSNKPTLTSAPAGLTLKVNSATGTFTGTVRTSQSGKVRTLPYMGVLLSAPLDPSGLGLSTPNGCGYFFDGKKGAEVEISQ